MDTKTQIKTKENKNERKQMPDKKQKGKGIHIDSTPVSEKVNPRAGESLKNEGTNFTYEEER